MSNIISTRAKFITSFFGFISGFLLLTTGNTLNFWISKKGFSLDTVGLFSLVCFPYAINFLWAPLLDRFDLKFIPIKTNFRIKWLILFYVMGFLICYLIAIVGINNIYGICILSIILSWINSSQDIILGAYRAEYLPKNFIGPSSGFYIFGYRMGMVLSGPAAIYASKYTSFELQYLVFGTSYSIFAVSVLLIDSIKSYQENDNSLVTTPYSLREIFENLGPRLLLFYIFIFLALYKLGDNLIGTMLNYYLLNLGFAEDQIALSGKLSGIFGSAAGGLIATNVMHKKNITDSLIIFGACHAFSHIGYILLSRTESYSIWLLIVTIFDSVTSGMSMSCYIAFITSLCHGRFKTTQYAIFSSVMGLSRAVFPAISGYIIATYDWDLFFVISIFMIIPSLIILKKIEALRKKVLF
ncbi:MAG: MFS transporter [Rickettsiaceae bacterium]|nr:MFS transporter [Rickettsiaceae bacterium]